MLCQTLNILICNTNVLPVYLCNVKNYGPYVQAKTFIWTVCYSFFDLLKYRLWQYGLWSFQTGGTKLEKNLPKNQRTHWKLLNFENCQKVPKFDIQSQFTMSKII